MKKDFCSFVVLFSMLFIFSGILCAGDDKDVKLTSEEFLSKARQPHGPDRWIQLSGEALHRRRGKDTEETTVYLGIMFKKVCITAQIILGGKEGYNISQYYKAENDSTSIIQVHKKVPAKSIFANFGLRPEDLTMSFLFWKFKKELETQSVMGRECRIFLLESPKKDELVEVAISTEYFFPIKVSWRKSDAPKTEKPYRNLEARNFSPVNETYLPSNIVFFGPGWKTMLDFDDKKAGNPKEEVPKDLFKKIKE